MKSEKLIEALGDIDDRLVLDVIPAQPRYQKRRWPTWVMAAAMLALCIFGASQLGVFSGLQPKQTATMDPAQTTEPMEPGSVQAPEESVNLPLLTLGSQYIGSGQEIWSTHSYNEVEQLRLNGLTDLEDLPETLPVYNNACPENEGGMYVGWEPDFEAMKATLTAAAAMLGIEGELQEEDVRVQMSGADGSWIKVDFRGTITVSLAESLPLPEDCGNESLEAAERMADWILETYGDRFDMVSPQASVSGGRGSTQAEQTYEICIYDGSGTQAEQLLRQTFDCVQFRLDQDGVTYVTVRRQQLGEKLGDYPILTAEEAETLFWQGYGMTSVWDAEDRVQVQKTRVMAMSVVYLNQGWFDCYLPFYRLLVEYDATLGGGRTYAAFYLPAVRPTYISDNRFWKAADTELTFEEKIWAAPDPDKVGDTAKEAFITFFQDNPEVMDTYGTYDLEFSQQQWEGREIAVLKCNGPLMAATGDSQTFWYDYDDGTVQFGPSGTWSPETVDYAEAVRRMLTERSPADSEDYDSYVREAFTRYYIDRLWGQYQNELQYLPEFQPNEEIDMDPLSLFTVVMSELPDTFTEAEFAAAVDVYFDGISYVDGSCELLEYENGMYRHSPMGLSDDFVYYQLTALSGPEDGVYEAQFDGIRFLTTDLFEQHEGEHSRNWKQLDAWYGGISSVVPNEVIQALLLSEPDLEKAGFEVSEKLTVTFRLQEGAHPFQYLSCSRRNLPVIPHSMEVGGYQISFDLPRDWAETCEIVPGEAWINFYQTASRQEDTGGRLFCLSLVAQKDLEQYRNYAGFERVLASDADYALVLYTPTDVQFVKEAAAEYQAMSAEIDAIADTVTMARP